MAKQRNSADAVSRLESWEEEQNTVSERESKTTMTSGLGVPKYNMVQGGLLLLAATSFVFGNHVSGFKALQEVLSGSMNALVLAWLPKTEQKNLSP